MGRGESKSHGLTARGLSGFPATHERSAGNYSSCTYITISSSACEGVIINGCEFKL